jgi:CBS domain-containing protein
MPVVDDGKLVGVVSQRDLLAASLSRVLEFDRQERRSFLRSIDVREVMASKPITVSASTPLRDAAALMLRHKIGCLPVVGPGGEAIGLVTETDLLRAAYGESGGRAGSLGLVRASARKRCVACWRHFPGSGSTRPPPRLARPRADGAAQTHPPGLVIRSACEGCLRSETRSSRDQGGRRERLFWAASPGSRQPRLALHCHRAWGVRTTRRALFCTRRPGTAAPSGPSLAPLRATGTAPGRAW